MMNLFENLQMMKESNNKYLDVKKESLSRNELIDEIEKYYSKSGYVNDLSSDGDGISPNMTWWEFVEQEIKKISGKSEEELPDDDPNEGFYSNLSTSELEEVLSDIHATIEKLTENNKTTIELTNKELQLVKTAMEMWSNVSFSKSYEEADIAKDILNKLK